MSHPGLIIGHYDHVRERGEYVRRLLRRRRPLPAVTPRPAEPTVSPAFVAMLDDVLAGLGDRTRAPQVVFAGPITPRRILMTVADKFETSAGHIQGRSRRLVYCHPRFAYVSLLREFLGWSYTIIGRELGIDHTSALHAVRRCNALRQSEPDYAARYEAAHAALTCSAGGAL